MANIIVLAVLVLAIVTAGYNIYKNAKNGKCSCGCSNCSQSGNCHK